MRAAMRALWPVARAVGAVAVAALAMPSLATAESDTRPAPSGSHEYNRGETFLAMRGVARQTLGGICELDKDCNSGRCMEKRCVCAEDSHCEAPLRCRMTASVPNRCAP